MTRKVTVDVELLEDFAAISDILFSIAIKKNLTEEEFDRMKYVNKLLLTCTDLLNKALER